ncbi:LysR family transcriptional regulator [Neisseria weaveri]|uniref:LysR family transcriptional regulator n=1 Tax=Neisseria weaveri TaxID=28091 RepID=A0A3S5A7D8_9NEIS|nr:LysR family transcriptional regulator [Neisseria weaveri]EGV37278.1 LysR family transcriptional regulator [Neisseria weaveri LMG 5135]VEJ49511.1 LysR family transcriptional regulator [Neisseria weaveri]
MNITLRQLKAFITVAQFGSFTRAAEALHLTQSALSGLIKELEQNLDVKLFDRTTRQLHLSAFGSALLPQVQRILNEVSSLNIELHNLKNHQQGQVHIAVSQQLAASALPALIAAFQKQYPDIQANLIDCSVEQVLQRVEDNEADFGIGPERSCGSDIERELLFTLPFYLVVPDSHRLARQTAVQWSALSEESLITLSSPFTDRLASSLPPHMAGYIQQPRYRVNFLSTALGMTKAGLGITICLPYASDWVRQHGLVMRKLDNPVINRSFYLYRRSNRSLSPAAEALKAFTHQYTRSNFFSAAQDSDSQ